MLHSVSTFDLRVTNIYRNDNTYIAFSGVPIKKGNSFIAKEIYIVNTKPSLIATQPEIGQCWRVHGEFERVEVNHGRYQITEVRINPDKCECVLPETKEAIVRFLSDAACFKGIGDSKARMLVETFPKNLFQVLKNNETDKLVSQAGLTQRMAESLVEGFKKYSNLEYAHWLSEKHVPMEVIQRLLKYHGRETIEQIQQNPYRLLYFGIPFRTKHKGELILRMGVDEIATKNFDIAFNDPRRLSGAVDDVMNSIVKEGHSCVTEAELINRLKRLLGSEKLTIDTALEVGKNTASIKVTEGNIYHPLGVLVIENIIAKRLISLHANSFWSTKHDDVFHQITNNLSFPLLDRQLEAVRGALEHGVYAITGGAGTGKTTVLKTIMTGYKKLGIKVRGIALSGRAAMRMSEATGFECCTIAKFLSEGKIVESVIGAVIIDEASMIDLKDMYRITMHIPRTTRLLFVGDASQLPPIGAGLVFHDILESGVIGRTILDTAKRQGPDSFIPQYSIQIKDGEVPKALSNGNVTFHECGQYKVETAVTRLLELCGKEETQIITPTNSKKNAINALCQERFNPDGRRMLFKDNGQFQYVKIKENDPVIFTQNNYDAKVWNGTMGYLTQASSDNPDTLGVVEDDSGAEVPISLKLVDSLELAYSITLHKAQGSQFKRVIIALTNSKQLDRSWLYTAITRATDHVHIVGTREMFETATQRVSAVKKRKTFLKSLLRAYKTKFKNQSA